MSQGKLAAVAVIVALIVAFLWLDLGRYLDLEYLKSRQADIDALYREHPLTLLAAYFAAYVAITGLSLPGAAIMTLAGGGGIRIAVGAPSWSPLLRPSAPLSRSSSRATSCETGSSGVMATG